MDLSKRDAARNSMTVFVEELNRLDPYDFVPAARDRFVTLRQECRRYLDPKVLVHGKEKIAKLGKKMSEILDLYGGDGSRAVMRSFGFVKDSKLRTIIERDYRELALFVFPSQAWKSTVVLAGSILEAILQDRLTYNSAETGKAESAPSAPKKSNLKAGEWRLHDLIQVAIELKILPEDRTKAIDAILRDYRNYVHPTVELRDRHPCTEAEGLLAKGALDLVCNHLEMNPAQ